MASYRIEFKRSAERDLRKVSPAFVAAILDRIESLAEDPFPRQSTKLRGAERTYRLRLGAYRIIYQVDAPDHRITVQYIRHRREAYRRS